MRNAESRLLSINITQLDHGKDLPLPSYGTALSAGMDLYAAIPHPIVLEPGARCLIPSGICIAIPGGYEAQVRPRSGLALKNGITVLNAPGTIDADYRGEIMGIMINHGQTAFTFTPGMRFAQLIITRHETVKWTAVASLEETNRGSKGFGSTGTGG